jgi:cyclic pyranopterin phosphate synthase
MVDVTDKPITRRSATASCTISLPSRITDSIFRNSNDLNNKGNILHTVRLAGVMGAKRTAELIPLCHQIPLSQVTVEIKQESDTSVRITGTAKAHNSTGVEMEAMTAVSISALTLYDMTKSAIKGTSDRIIIQQTILVSKSGGSFDIS